MHGFTCATGNVGLDGATRLDSDLVRAGHLAVLASELLCSLHHVHAADHFAKHDVLPAAPGKPMPLRNDVATHSSHSHLSAVVMKNWEPLVLGPELALDRSPASASVSSVHARCAGKTCCRASSRTSRRQTAAQVSIALGSQGPDNPPGSRSAAPTHLAAVDRDAASAVAALKVTSLDHEPRDDPMEASALVSEALGQRLSVGLLRSVSGARGTLRRMRAAPFQRTELGSWRRSAVCQQG